jgi:hypothetical protein
MTKLVSFLAIPIFVLSISSAEAAKKKPQVATAGPAPVQTSAPVQNRYPRRGNTAWAPTTSACKMSGRC